MCGRATELFVQPVPVPTTNCQSNCASFFFSILCWVFFFPSSSFNLKKTKNVDTLSYSKSQLSYEKSNSATGSITPQINLVVLNFGLNDEIMRITKYFFPHSVLELALV